MKIKKINIKSVEIFLNKKLKRNCISVGYDVAMHSTGIVRIRTTEDFLVIEDMVRIITPNDISQNDALDLFTEQLDTFKNKENEKPKINISIIEDCFFGQNVNTLKALARHSVLVYDRMKRISNITMILLPISARSKVGFVKSNKKIKRSMLKKEIMNFVSLALDTKIKDEHLADGCILALAGLIKE